MKEETEVKWIVNLLNDEQTLSKKGGSISQYEQLCKAPTNSKEFRMWFKKIVQDKIINFVEYEENKVGIPTKIYKLNVMKMIDYLNQFELYKKTYNVALKDYFAVKRS
jgi:hypothetical protein